MPLTLLAPRQLYYGAPVHHAAPLNQGLVGWWLVLPRRRGGVRWLDLLGQRHATLIGSMAASTATSGWSAGTRPGGWGSLRCDGSNDIIRIPNAPSLNVAQVTCALWVFKRRNEANYGCMVGRQLGTQTINLFALLYRNTTSDEYVWNINTAGGNGDVIGPASTGDLNRWVHLVATYDGTTMALYKNGLFLASNPHPFPGPLPNETTTVTLGANYNGNGRDTGPGDFAQIGVDDFRYYSRVLTASEVSLLYQASRRGYPQELRWTRPLHVVPILALPPGAVIDLTGALLGESLTTDALADLPTLRALTAALTSASTTPPSLVTTDHLLTAGLSGSSATPTSLVTQTRTLTAALTGSSTTPASVGGNVRQLTASLMGTTTTPGSAAVQARPLTAALPGTSITPATLVTVTRPLVSTLSGTSTTRAAAIQLPAFGQGRLDVATPSATWTLLGTDHAFGTPNLLVQAYDASTPFAEQIQGAITVHPSSYDVQARFAQAQSGYLLVSADATTSVALPFTDATPGTPVTFAGPAHGLGTPNLFVQVYDTNGNQIPVRIRVHQTTYDVVVEVAQTQSGRIVVASAPPTGGTLNASEALSGTTSSTFLQTEHGRVNAALLVQVYDATGLQIQGAVTVDPTLLDITTTFVQAQPGRVVVGGGLTAPPFAQGRLDVLLPTTTWTLPGSVHGLETPALLVQLYDASTPLAEQIQGAVTVHPTSYDVEARFAQEQSGYLLVSADAQPSAGMTFTNATPGTPITFAAAAHGLGTPNLLVQVYDTSGTQISARVRVHQTTSDVLVEVAQMQSGRIVVASAIPSGAGTNPSEALSGGTSSTFTQAEHGRATPNLLVQVYDAGTPALQIQGAVTVDPVLFTVTTAFGQAQPGRVVLGGGVTAGLVALLGELLGTSSTPASLVTVARLLPSSLVGASVTPVVLPTIQRGLTAALSGSSLTAEAAIVLTALRALTANLSGTSTTPASLVSQARLLTATLLGASTTPPVVTATQRLLTAALTGNSLTGEATIVLTVLRALTGSLGGVSTTPASLVTLQRALSAQVAALSLTPDAAVVLTGLRALTATLNGTSTTPASLVTLARMLTATLLGTSTTPASLVTVQRPLGAHPTGASVTADATVVLTALRALTATLSGLSTTPASLVTVARSLTAAVVGASTTPATLVTHHRPLVAQLTGASVTSDATVVVTALRALTATVTGLSTTPAAVTTVVRLLQSAGQGSSVTPAIVVTTPRPLTSALLGTGTTPPSLVTVSRTVTATLLASSVTPDVFAHVQEGHFLPANLVGASTTPAVVATQQHLLSAQLSGSSATRDAASAAVRPLTASLTNASTTPVSDRLLVRGLLALPTGVSTTPAVLSTQQHLLSAQLSGSSTTPASMVLLQLGLTGALTTASTTSASGIVLERLVTASLSGGSTTPDAAVIVSQLRVLTASLHASSTTLSSAVTQSWALTSTLVGTSTTPPVLVRVQRPLTATLLASSTTPPGLLANTALLQSSIQGTSTTPVVQVVPMRLLRALPTGVSMTPPILVQHLRVLQSVLSGVSLTPDSQGLGIWQLLSGLLGSSATSTSPVLMARELVAMVTGTSQTPAGLVTTVRPIEAHLEGSSTTPLVLLIPNSGQMACRAALVGVSTTSAAQVLFPPRHRVGVAPVAGRGGSIVTTDRVGQVTERRERVGIVPASPGTLVDV